MEGINRKPLQGLIQIVRFNYPWYIVALGASMALLLLSFSSSSTTTTPCLLLGLLVLLPGCISLLVSAYVYDFSGLYRFSWFSKLQVGPNADIVNIHSGFDETSGLLKVHFPESQLRVFDFYDPKKHTEFSIRQARKARAAYPGTQAVQTHALPLKNASVDCVFLLFAAHEIRDESERIVFFRQLGNALRPAGKIVVVEHLRNTPNFLAYSMGFFHFFSSSAWLNTFAEAGLRIESAFSLNPFVKCYILIVDGHTT
jgi:SAM-dependent methyltransferase